jgi:2-iminoacetate synthase
MDILDMVLSQEFRDDYTDSDVRNALNKDVLTTYDFQALLSSVAENHLEEIARHSKALTRKQYGNSVSMYTPLYISNYCDNQCTYCGFNSKNDINRGKLSLEEIEKELKAIAETGLEELLLLTGESREISSVEYIGEAVKLAAKYFLTVGIEVYPLSTDEYEYINKCGADFVSIYQETYNIKTYEKYHVSGPKRDFKFRFNSQERAVKAGMRGVSFGALLGLGDPRYDAFATGLHAYYLQRKYPHAEISFSAPRLRSFINSGETALNATEKLLLQVFMAYRIFMPFTSIVISTRERPGFRDNVIGLAANKISAGVRVGVGGHSCDSEQKGDEQFDISDPRTTTQIHEMILSRGLQPVYTDYIRII